MLVTEGSTILVMITVSLHISQALQEAETFESAEVLKESGKLACSAIRYKNGA
jgi:hypothetical protein